MSKLLVIAGGSASSIIATYLYLSSGLVRIENVLQKIKVGEIQVIFTQAFQVGEHPKFGVSEALKAVRALPEDGQVVWIGLGVNNQDQKMTEDIFREIGIDHLHTVYDEHEPERWAVLIDKVRFSSRTVFFENEPGRTSFGCLHCWILVGRAQLRDICGGRRLGRQSAHGCLL